MWAAIFSPRRQIEVRPPPSAPSASTPLTSAPHAPAGPGPSPSPSPGPAPKIKAESRATTSPTPDTRPTVSSKRPRSSSGASPHRKRTRRSSFHFHSPRPPSSSSSGLPRSPLVRARRVSDGPVESPLKQESFSSALKTLAIAPRRRPRLSYLVSVEPEPGPEEEKEEGGREDEGGHRGENGEGEGGDDDATDPDSSSSSEQDAHDVEELLRDGFSVHEVELFQHIRKRGLEPLMPAHWQVDFGTMPDNLFVGPEEAAYVDGVAADGTFSATAAFQAVVNMGAAVRAKLEIGQEAEGRVVFGLKKYIQWAVDDAKQAGKQIHPLITLSTSLHKGTSHCEHRMEKKLHLLAAEFRVEESRLSALSHPRPPSSSSTIYGLAVAGPVVALITLDARVPGAPTRTLLVVDFSDVTVDFWNAVGVALLVVAARDDELERAEWYESVGVKRREWEGGVKMKREVESDEDR